MNMVDAIAAQIIGRFPRLDPAEVQECAEDVASAVEVASDGMVMRKLQPGTPCRGDGCGRPLRPRKTTLEQYPGTAKHHGRGLCERCHRRVANQVRHNRTPRKVGKVAA